MVLGLSLFNFCWLPSSKQDFFLAFDKEWMSRHYASARLDVGLRAWRAWVLPTGKFPPLAPLKEKGPVKKGWWSSVEIQGFNGKTD